MKKFIYAFAFLLLTSEYADSMPSVTLIAADELKKMQDDGANFKLIDARDVNKFAAEHIKGAVSLPYDKVNSESLAKIAPEMNTKLVFYCDEPGNSSRISSQKALGAGYQYVYRYPNGLSDWKAKGYPVEK